MWQTPRLNIRALRLDDWEDLHALQGDPEATKFIGGPWSADKTRDVTRRIVEAYPHKPLEWFAGADRSTDRVMGVCWLGQLNPNWCEALGWGPEIELGYRYARPYWNRGYATEAGHAMLRRGFHELGLESIVAIVDVLNPASERVMQKLGMALEAHGQRDTIRLRGYRINRDGFIERGGNEAGPDLINA